MLAQILAAKGDQVALQIEIRTGLTGKPRWSILVVPKTADAVMINGLPFLYDQTTAGHLEGLRIDWVRTAEGEGLGVYHTGLHAGDHQKRSG